MGFKLALAAAAALTLSLPAIVSAQSVGRAIVTTYRAAPGHQVELLKWLAQQQRIAAAAGVPASQLYVHANGDSWDYLLIAPQTTQAQDDALEAAAKRLGLPTGPRVGIELRKHVGSHTDTIVRGPMSVTAYLGEIGEQ